MSQKPAMLNHMPLVRELCAKLGSAHHQRQDQKRTRRSEDLFMRDFVHRQVSWTGDQRMAKIMQMCNTLPGYDLSPFQKLCLKEMLQCMSPLIFGNPPAHELAMNLRKYGMEVPRTQMVFMGTSRRGGKTDIMTMCAAAILAVVPNAKLLYFSIYDRTCEVACNTVYRWLMDWKMGHLIRTKSKLQITLQGDSVDDIRVIIFINGQSPDVSLFIYVFLLYKMEAANHFFS